jgi:hypothetical protein
MTDQQSITHKEDDEERQSKSWAELFWGIDQVSFTDTILSYSF